MGSLKNYLDRTQQERDNLNAVIDDAAVTVDVYRRLPQAGVAGLTAPATEAQPLKSIEVRFDSYRSRSRAAGSQALRDTVIGLTSDIDVLKDDLWRYTDIRNRVRWYRVDDVRRTQSTSTAVLEEIKR